MKKNLPEILGSIAALLLAVLTIVLITDNIKIAENTDFTSSYTQEETENTVSSNTSDTSNTSTISGTSSISSTSSTSADDSSKDTEVSNTPNNNNTPLLNEEKRRIIGYFCEWRDKEEYNNYTVASIPWESVTHINYAFAAVDDFSKIAIMDSEYAIEKEYPEIDKSLPYKGHFGMLTTYKKKYPEVKTLISVGGWAASDGLYKVTDNTENMKTFADSCVDFIRKYNFNGVDIDFEYPSSTSQSGNPKDFSLAEPRRSTVYKNYVEMMRILRETLDKAGDEDNVHYILSVAAPASAWVLGGMELSEYAEYLDYLNMMSYDFHGAWNQYVGPQAGLYPSDDDTETAAMAIDTLGADWAFKYYSGILPPEKINMGVPYYTRGWVNVSGGNNGLWGTSSTGASGQDGIWNDPAPEAPSGTNPLWHIKNLLADTSLGYEYFFDEKTKTPYVWNQKTKTFLTFEDEKSVTERCNYIIENNLGGYMTWELAGDFDDGKNGEYSVGSTLTDLAAKLLGGSPLKITKPSIPEKTTDFSFEFSGRYDHPNYTYSFTITNNTESVITKGTELAFDLPNSAEIQTSPWGVSSFTSEKGKIFTRYKCLLPQDIPAGGSYTLQGMIKLCFAGGFSNVSLDGVYSKTEFS